MANSAESLASARADVPALSGEIALCLDRYCIIGAGPAGLGVARRLREGGVDFDVVERHRDVGGIWDLENPGTPIYESAHFISSKTLSGYTDFQFPAEAAEYPSRDSVLAFIRAYADHFDLRRHVQFGMEVVRLEPHAAGWLVHFAGAPARVYRGVVLANGHQWVPNWPRYPGAEAFRGQSFHSIDYRSASCFDGKRVLIVGCGASAVDIANDAAPRARTTFLSARRGHYFVPKHMFGKPTDVWASSGPALPARVRQLVLSRLLRFLYGDLTRYGFAKPDHDILERPPILNSQIFEHLSHGRLRVKPDVRRVGATDVEFVDGSHEAFDVIVYCTGYLECWPFLAPTHLSPTGADDLYLHLFHRRFDNLFVVGLLRTNAGGFAMFERQGQVIAKALSASDAQRERLRQLTRAPKAPRRRGIAYQKNSYQSAYLDAATYERELRALERVLER